MTDGRKKHHAVPRQRATDGTLLLCGAPTTELGKCTCCGADQAVTLVCTYRATYPDKRCAEHTEWLKGTRTQRRKADVAREGPRGSSARSRAWSAFDSLQNPLKTKATP